MNNQIIKIDEESFLYKIKKFFSKIKKIFNYKDVKKNNFDIESIPNFNKTEEKEYFLDELKKENNQAEYISSKDDFLEKIDGNKELLEMLSIERLEMLEKYYVELIKQNEIKIKKLSENV